MSCAILTTPFFSSKMVLCSNKVNSVKLFISEILIGIQNLDLVHDGSDILLHLMRHSHVTYLLKAKIITTLLTHTILICSIFPHIYFIKNILEVPYNKFNVGKFNFFQTIINQNIALLY